MQIHSLPSSDVYAALHTSPRGLGADEAARRFQEFGPNELSPSRQISLGRKLLRQFTHFLALLLWIAACLAYLASALQPGESMETLAHAIVAVIVINALFSFFRSIKPSALRRRCAGSSPIGSKYAGEGR